MNDIRNPKVKFLRSSHAKIICPFWSPCQPPCNSNDVERQWCNPRRPFFNRKQWIFHRLTILLITRWCRTRNSRHPRTLKPIHGVRILRRTTIASINLPESNDRTKCVSVLLRILLSFVVCSVGGISDSERRLTFSFTSLVDGKSVDFNGMFSVEVSNKREKRNVYRRCSEWLHVRLKLGKGGGSSSSSSIESFLLTEIGRGVAAMVSDSIGRST